ncbi:MAG: hypothetical protein HEQ38_09135 [Gemmatimonas sp.]|uniref:hypothetical protein n=1 Tax=Gemmatimonas sp. TaxID=1962908 RepID=UPI0031C5EC30|nr:hypothetical protein [Gemmatimonas sp.]
MSHDENRTPRSADLPADRHADEPGWEAEQEKKGGWEHRNDRVDRLREGDEHPLHHGQTLHGGHAFDGEAHHDPETPKRVNPKSP